LYLGHISRECNRPELALRVMSERLDKIAAQHVRVELTSQKVPCQTLTLSRLAYPVQEIASSPLILRETYTQTSLKL